MTATPIPRTLQMALSGVRELSLIATPPVDRLAVRTFVMPYDGVITREAILRERYRGGKTFYVCPRIEDLARDRKSVGQGERGSGRVELGGGSSIKQKNRSVGHRYIKT